MNKFIDAIVKAYNGFSFNPLKKESEESEGLISPISFINHMAYLYKNEKNEMVDPFFFRNYWTSTGITENIQNFVGKMKNPLRFPKLLMEVQITPFNVTKLNERSNIREIDLDLLLFSTGYFSIKKCSGKDTVSLDWTNSETRRAFYRNYVDQLNLEKNFILRFFNENLSIGKSENEKEELSGEKREQAEKEFLEDQFLSYLENAFAKMLESYYVYDRRDQEHNYVHNLFVSTLDAFLDDYQCFMRYKLVPDFENPTSEPDIILITHDNKQIIILEFLEKKKNMNTYFFFPFFI